MEPESAAVVLQDDREAPGDLVRGAERQLESHPCFLRRGPGGAGS